MDNTLIIDCSSGMNIIVIKDDEIFRYLDFNQKRHTDELLLSVDKLLNESNLKINDIKNLCVTIGPGSFTGIRVAISICKGLATGINAKLFSLSNFDVYNYNQSKNYVCILDGFSDFVYTRVKSNGKVEDACEHISDLIFKLKNELLEFNIFVQNEKIFKILEDNGIKSSILKLDLENSFSLIIEKNKTINMNQIIPIYLRASQAEIERNKRLNGA